MVRISVILFVSSVILVLGTTLYLFFFNRGWRCSEKGCEYVFGGDFHTEKSCKDVCKHSDDQDDKLAALEKNLPYACTNDYKCVPSPDGIYTSEAGCKSGCQPPTTTYYRYPYYGYPYYGYPYYYYPQSLYRRPYYLTRGRKWRGDGEIGCKGTLN